MSHHAYVSQQQPNLTPLDLNHSVVRLFQCQIELIHSIQCLHQQMMDALQNIARSSPFKESQHFMNDIPIFKAKDAESFDDWLEKVKNVNKPLTNKTCINWHLQNLRDHSVEQSAHFHPLWDETKL